MHKSISAAVIILTSTIASNAAVAEENPGHIGIGSYSLSITDQVTTDTFSGPALLAGYDINKFITIDTHIYALKHEDHSTIEMNGYDALLRLGRGGPGFNLAFTAAIWSETMSSPSTSSLSFDYSGTSLGVSTGYSWDNFSVLLEGTRRTIKDYQGSSPGDYDAATTGLNVAFRF